MSLSNAWHTFSVLSVAPAFAQPAFPCLRHVFTSNNKEQNKEKGEAKVAKHARWSPGNTVKISEMQAQHPFLFFLSLPALGRDPAGNPVVILFSLSGAHNRFSSGCLSSSSASFRGSLVYRPCPPGLRVRLKADRMAPRFSFFSSGATPGFKLAL